MVCHDAWFFGMHMIFHKVWCNPLLAQQCKPCLEYRLTSSWVYSLLPALRNRYAAACCICCECAHASQVCHSAAHLISVQIRASIDGLCVMLLSCISMHVQRMLTPVCPYVQVKPVYTYVHSQHHQIGSAISALGTAFGDALDIGLCFVAFHLVLGLYLSYQASWNLAAVVLLIIFEVCFLLPCYERWSSICSPENSYRTLLALSRACSCKPSLLARISLLPILSSRQALKVFFSKGFMLAREDQVFWGAWVGALGLLAWCKPQVWLAWA